MSASAFSVTAYKPLTSTLYLIGSATPGGWSADDATEMTRKDNGIFTWTGRLVAGEFKFITTLGSFLPSYNKGTDGLLVLRSSDTSRMNLLLSKKTIITSSRPICLPVFLH